MNDFFKTKLVFLIGLLTVLLTIKGFQFDSKVDFHIILFNYSISLLNIYYILIISLFFSIFSYAFLFIKDGKYKFSKKIGDFFYSLSLLLPIIFLLAFLLMDLIMPIVGQISFKILVSIILLLALTIFIISVVISSNYVGKISHSIMNNSIDVMNMDFNTGDKIIYNISKRSLDILFSSLAIVLFLPILIIIVGAIKIDTRGPIFFTQKRIGLNGKTFRLLKFRTMYRNAYKVVNISKVEIPDPQITKIGRILRRTLLDEIPMLFNIIKGEVSLIGPRPLLPYLYNEVVSALNIQDVIIRTKPGLVGLATLNAKFYYYSFNKYFNLDIYYIKNRSIKMDILIFLASIKIVAFNRS